MTDKQPLGPNQERCADGSPVLWVERRDVAIDITARDVGIQFVGDDSSKQAAILRVMAEEVESWRAVQSWPQQCRSIAEELTNEECQSVRSMLESLVEHLEAIPVERQAKALTEKALRIVNAVVQP